MLAWCYDRELPVIPRGGGTGYAGGAVPVEGGVVVALDRLTRVRSFEPHWWRAELEAGLTTATVDRLARENGLLFPPNPGAPEQSQLGGNVATNAGGPRAFKYGVTGRWVTGIEAAVAPGELVRIGGATRKDVAGYDLRNLLVGSEGTLGIITSVWLRFVPAPETSVSVAAFYPDRSRAVRRSARCSAAAWCRRRSSTPTPVCWTRRAAPSRAALPGGARFLVLLELDGSADEVRRDREEAIEALSDAAISIFSPADAAEGRALWRWRAGMGPAVTAVTGGRVSEDVAVPPDRLVDVVVGVTEIGARHGLTACSLGHAGDGNVHGCFLLVPGTRPARAGLPLLGRAVRAGAGARRNGVRRARHRLDQARPDGSPVGAGGCPDARRRQGGARPQEPTQSREEDVNAEHLVAVVDCQPGDESRLGRCSAGVRPELSAGAPSATEIVDRAESATVLVTLYTYTRVGADVLERLPGLRLVATRTAGYSHIDVVAAAARGIGVVAVPEARPGGRRVHLRSDADAPARARRGERQHPGGRLGVHRVSGGGAGRQHPGSDRAWPNRPSRGRARERCRDASPRLVAPERPPARG